MLRRLIKRLPCLEIKLWYLWSPSELYPIAIHPTKESTMSVQTKISYTPYKEQDFSHLKGLHGISDKTLEIHLALYAGYVKNTNTLCEKVIELTEQGKSGQPEYAEIKRRYGFEYNGKVLHEYYFGNMKANGNGELKDSTALGKKIVEVYGSLDTWKNDFFKVGAMRG